MSVRALHVLCVRVCACVCVPCMCVFCCAYGVLCSLGARTKGLAAMSVADNLGLLSMSDPEDEAPAEPPTKKRRASAAELASAKSPINKAEGQRSRASIGRGTHKTNADGQGSRASRRRSPC